MNGKKIIISIVVLAALILLYFVVKHFQNPYTKPKQQNIITEIKNKHLPSTVTSLTLKGKGNKDGSYKDDASLLVDGEVVISKKSDGWVLPGLYNYPANREEVEKLIISLMQISDVTLVGKSAGTQKDCEVDAQKGKKIIAENQNKEELCNFTIGKSAAGSMNKCYMRFKDSQEVYSAKPNLSWKLKLNGAPKDWPGNWMDKNLIKFNSDKEEKIKKIEVTRRDGKDYTLEKVETKKEVKDTGSKKNTDASKKEKPKTVTETKWYVVTKAGTRFEADSSAQSSFTGAFDNLTGGDPKAPGNLEQYGFKTPYASYKVTTVSSKDKKEKTYTLLLGDRVPEEPKVEETAKDETAKDKTAATKDKSSKDKKVASKKDKTSNKTPPAKKKPKLTDDRYVELKGDRRIMTLKEWKLKSIDKNPTDFKPKKKEKKAAAKKTPGDKTPTLKTSEKKEVKSPKKVTKTIKKVSKPKTAITEKTQVEKLGAKHILISYKKKGSDSTKVTGITRTKEEALKKAKEILAELKKNPEKFSELAKKWSDCPSKAKGGDLGTFAPNDMVPPFTKAVQGLKVGEISDIVETQFGYHIIMRTK